MTYKADKEIDLVKSEITGKYIISSQHRKIGNPNKCVWTITHQEEVSCFINTKKSKWINGAIGWGIKLSNNSIQPLGKNNDDLELKFAKFVDSSKNDIWHGYPADYLNRVQDIPDTEILISWAQNKYIQKHQVRKIKSGMPCNL